MATRDTCRTLDAADPLAACRQRFDLPADLIYLDGNSLGPLPRATPRHIAEVLARQWGEGLIRSWNEHGWIDLAARVAGKIAPVVGAAPGEIAVGDSTSVNLFKVVAAALELAPEQRVILSTRDNFPTDLYMLQGLERLLGERVELRLVDEVERALSPEVAVVALSHVQFKTGRLCDLRALTEAIHAAGALAVWDLAHSAGALPVELRASGADFAVGCGYKFLNGGPGAPAFLFVAERHQEKVQNPLSGWLGHAAPFAFETTYRPAPGIQRFVCGTPPILALAALETGLDTFTGVDLAALRAKSEALGTLFLELAAERLAAWGLETACPSDARERGSQVSFRHPEGYAIIQALIARGVIGDFRAPDILRFGLTPLYLRYADIWDAVETLRQVLETRAWDRPEFRRRGVVT